MTTFEKKILIVDDDKRIVSKLSSLFREKGYATFEAGDGEEGLRLALSTNPDLIILDINMPKRNGLSMLEELRKDTFGAKVPVIILSALSNDILVRYSLESSANEYLNKNTNSYKDVLSKAKKYLE